MTVTKEDLDKSFAGFNEKGEVVLRLEPATPEVIDRHNRIKAAHKEGKLKELVEKGKLEIA